MENITMVKSRIGWSEPMMLPTAYYVADCFSCFLGFSVLTLLVGQQEGHLA